MAIAIGAWLVGPWVAVVMYLVATGHSLDSAGDGSGAVPYLAAFWFVFGLTVNRWWALSFPALQLLWDEATSVGPIEFQGNPSFFETFLISAAAITLGLVIRRTYRHWQLTPQDLENSGGGRDAP